MRTGWQEIELNGVPQWVSLRGPDPNAPLLLFLHGGPGGAEFGPRRHYLRDLETRWRVVDWEQRGAGRSYTGTERAGTLSLGILVEDGLALVDRLVDETGGPLVLVGHSFGTVLGVLMAIRAPDRIGAYIGVSQVVDWALQEERSYDWVLAEARRVGNAKAVAALEAIGRPVRGIYPGGTASVEVQRRWLGSLGGVSGDPGFLMRWMLTILAARDYPVRTKVRFSKGMRRSMDLIWPELGERVHFSRDVNRLDVPVHLFGGDRDRITGLDQVGPWLDQLTAPTKELAVIEGAGHLSLYEAPDRFVAFVNSVGAGATVPGRAEMGLAQG